MGEYVVDLTAYLSKEYGDYHEKFYGNVFDAFSYKEKIYAIPSGFYIKTLIGKEKNMGGLESWDIEQMSVLTEVLIPNMENYIDWENGKALFDSDSYRNLLTFAKEFPTSPGKKPDYNDYAENRALLYYLFASSEYDVAQAHKIFRDEKLTYIGYPSDDKRGTRVQTGGTTLAISIAFLLSQYRLEALLRGFRGIGGLS